MGDLQFEVDWDDWNDDHCRAMLEAAQQRAYDAERAAAAASPTAAGGRTSAAQARTWMVNVRRAIKRVGTDRGPADPRALHPSPPLKPPVYGWRDA